MTEKSFVAGRLLVVRDWYVKGRLAFTCVLLEADAINVPTVLLKKASIDFGITKKNLKVFFCFETSFFTSFYLPPAVFFKAKICSSFDPLLQIPGKSSGLSSR